MTDLEIAELNPLEKAELNLIEAQKISDLEPENVKAAQLEVNARVAWKLALLNKLTVNNAALSDVDALLVAALSDVASAQKSTDAMAALIGKLAVSTRLVSKLVDKMVSGTKPAPKPVSGS